MLSCSYLLYSYDKIKIKLVWQNPNLRKASYFSYSCFLHVVKICTDSYCFSSIEKYRCLTLGPMTWENTMRELFNTKEDLPYFQHSSNKNQTIQSIYRPRMFEINFSATFDIFQSLMCIKMLELDIKDEIFRTTGWVAHWVKCLPYKHEELSSDSHHPFQK